MIHEIDRLHYLQVVHDINKIVIVKFIFCILWCFLKWEIRLKITFIWKIPIESSANLHGIEIKYTIHKQF